ncbi:putative membrane protein [Allocatelliglobosispora scoriae]|uniref:Putative membrane protein n=1 Tax=Allocatelliglobosispora scoriae TaxID=643052 RepID=A0A841C214_9ACTN|nr:hypothetical protein [Allocatelliglobosispora scoriae]MBB5873798.1 putative membrane protein [Allocatelliglobosispora scoriae]
MTVRPVERLCYLLGLGLIAAGLAHAVVLVVTGGSWSGPVSLRKPATFGVSFGLTLITIAWVASFLPLGDRGRGWLLGLLAGASVVEVGLISVQAWRGVPSHINFETATDSMIARVLAGGGFVLIAVIAALTVVSLRPHPTVAPSMRLAVRAGLLILDVSLLTGAVMIFNGVRTVFGENQQAAYAALGTLKPVHAVTMHAVLVLPLLAWLIRTRWTEPRRVQAVRAAIAAYAAVATAAAATLLAL